MKITGWKVFAGLVAVLMLVGCGRSSTDNAEASGGARIAVIPKGTSHVFWKSVEAGAKQAGEELGVKVIWKGPLKENDRAQQIAIVEQFVTEGVDAIVLAPLDQHALVRPVRAAAAAGIPVVIFDSALAGDAGKDFQSFVSTDNFAGGEMAGRHLASLLDGKGKVVLLRYQVGSASTHEREEGFLKALGAFPDIEVTVDNQYAGATVGEAIQKSEELLDKLNEADGVFAPNESSTAGMLITLRKHQLAGSIAFVGFDSSDELKKGLAAGEIQALVVQNPERMGSEGVRAAVGRLRGEPVEARIDTGVQLLTGGEDLEP